MLASDHSLVLDHGSEHWIAYLVAGGCQSWLLGMATCVTRQREPSSRFTASTQCDKSSAIRCEIPGVITPLHRSLQLPPEPCTDPKNSLLSLPTELCTGKPSEVFLPEPRGTERVNLVTSRSSSDARPTQHQFDTDFFGAIWVNLSGRAVHLTDREEFRTQRLHLLPDPPAPALSQN